MFLCINPSSFSPSFFLHLPSLLLLPGISYCARRRGSTTMFPSQRRTMEMRNSGRNLRWGLCWNNHNCHPFVCLSVCWLELLTWRLGESLYNIKAPLLAVNETFLSGNMSNIWWSLYLYPQTWVIVVGDDVVILNLTQPCLAMWLRPPIIRSR